MAFQTIRLISKQVFIRPEIRHSASPQERCIDLAWNNCVIIIVLLEVAHTQRREELETRNTLKEAIEIADRAVAVNYFKRDR